MPFYWRPRNYRRHTTTRNTWRWKGGRVMARRASRPATPFAISETLEPPTKMLTTVEDYLPRPRYIAPFRSTKSAVVKLTLNAQVTLVSTLGSGETQAVALQFTLPGVPGFTDYSTVYSEFRIIRGDVVFPTQEGENTTPPANYLVVSSQPFAQTAIPLSASTNVDLWVPRQEEPALRQARWQRVVYPETVTSGVRIGFYPYTMIATEGPSAADVRYQRIWTGGRWTPFSWATETNPITYFGPYVWKQTTSSDTSITWQPFVTITLYCVFRGQK